MDAHFLDQLAAQFAQSNLFEAPLDVLAPPTTSPRSRSASLASDLASPRTPVRSLPPSAATSPTTAAPRPTPALPPLPTPTRERRSKPMPSAVAGASSPAAAILGEALVRDFPLSGAFMGQLHASAAHEAKTRKARARERKTACSLCGLKTTRLFKCARCRCARRTGCVITWLIYACEAPHTSMSVLPALLAHA
jgi:hypothetical protein